MGELRKLVNLGLDLVVRTLVERLEEELSEPAIETGYETDPDLEDLDLEADPELESVDLFARRGTSDPTDIYGLPRRSADEEAAAEVEEHELDAHAWEARHRGGPAPAPPGSGRIFWLSFFRKGDDSRSKIFTVELSPRKTPEPTEAGPTKDEVRGVLPAFTLNPGAPLPLPADLVGAEPAVPVVAEVVADASVEPGPVSLDMFLPFDEDALRQAGMGAHGLELVKIRGQIYMHPDLARAVSAALDRDDEDRLGGLDRARRERGPLFGVEKVYVENDPLKNGFEAETMMRNGEEIQLDHEIWASVQDAICMKVNVYSSMISEEVLTSVPPEARLLTVALSGGFVSRGNIGMDPKDLYAR